MTDLKSRTNALAPLAVIRRIRHIRHATALLMLLAVTALAVPAFAADGVVNVNTADQDQLTLLPRVGPALAQRIIEYRDANGELSGTEDLMLVRGIGEKTFELLEPWVAVDGETTLSQKVRTAEAQERLARGDEEGGR